MPKRIGHLYEKMFDRDLIQRAIAEGTKGKRGRWDVEKVLTDVDGYVEKMHDMLIAESYVPTKPKSIGSTEITRRCGEEIFSATPDSAGASGREKRPDSPCRSLPQRGCLHERGS